MNERDKAIVQSLNSFKVLDRDQIIELHFKGVKDAISSCNKVLKRLQRDKYVTCDSSRRPFYYFPNPSPMKKDSMKLAHFKDMADFIIEAISKGNLLEYIIEPKVSDKKGAVEPDIFMVWNKAPFYVEIQRTLYSKKYMKAKIDRYKEYYASGDWKQHGQYFPYIWIVSNHEYNLDVAPLRVFQTKNVEEFVQKYVKKKGDQ